jgi:hypothetical protein
MTAHISKVVSTCFGILRQLRSVGRSLPPEMPSINLFKHSYSLEWITATLLLLEYRSDRPIVFKPSSKRLFVSLVALASSITSPLFSPVLPCSPLVSPVLRDAGSRAYQIQAVLAGLNKMAQSYLKLLSSASSRSRLRSLQSGDVLIPISHSQSGDSAVPRAWNNLPVEIKTSDSLVNFKKLLKTHFFKISYNL